MNATKIRAKLVQTDQPQKSLAARIAIWSAPTAHPVTDAQLLDDPVFALERLDDLGVQAYLLTSHDQPGATVCVFGFDDQLFVTEAQPSEAASALLALFFVLEMKSALT